MHNNTVFADVFYCSTICFEYKYDQLPLNPSYPGWGDAPVQDNLFSFALYVSFFPQLIAGPIVRYLDVVKEINERKETAYLRVSGIKRFCYGLGKKVLLANVFAETADKIFSLEPNMQTGIVAWLGIICYTLQIYYDFSGYSDMAIGL